MLSEKYKNALNGFKAQGNASHLFEECEAESQHIYRVIMSHNISVEELDETKLEAFLTQESEGEVGYPKFVDRDGLQYVDIEQDVEVYPCTTKGVATYPIEGQSYRLSSFEAKAMLNQLRDMGQLNLITDTLQGLAQRLDGTELQTAFPNLHEINACIDNGLLLPKSLIDKLREWEALNASEINFDFVDISSAQ
jgi:hypothetical protein